MNIQGKILAYFNYLFKNFFMPPSQLTLSDPGWLTRIKGQYKANKKAITPPDASRRQQSNKPFDGLVPLWAPQVCWQSQIFTTLQKYVQLGGNLHGDNVPQGGSRYLFGSAGWVSLGEGSCNIPCLPAVVGWVDVAGKRWSFK